MDIFIEKLVDRKKDGKDILIITGVIFLTVLLSFIVLVNFMYLNMFGPLIIAALIWACYIVVSSRSVEFEYSLTNNELDVDKIISRRKRKRVVTVDARKIEIFAPVLRERFARDTGNIKKTYRCDGNRNPDGTYFVVFFEKDGGKSALIFEPNEKMIDGFRRYNPSKVQTTL